MDFRETMRATQAPDVYCDVTCDQHEPRWVGSAEGDKDDDGPIGPDINLAARTFPPGTKLAISEPICPRCHETPNNMGDIPTSNGGWRAKWECGCDFDWHEWATNEFA